MSKSAATLLDELDELKFRLVQANRARENINRSIAEDEKILAAHRGALVEIAASAAVLESQIQDAEHELGLLAKEAEEDEQLDAPTMP